MPVLDCLPVVFISQLKLKAGQLSVVAEILQYTELYLSTFLYSESHPRAASVQEILFEE